MQLLFQLSAYHQYFTSGILSNSQFIAAPETQAYIDKYQLLTRSREGNYQLYFNSTATTNDFLLYLQELLAEEPLKFYLIYQGEDLNLITDVPLDWQGLFQASSKDVDYDSDGHAYRFTTKLVEDNVFNPSAIAVVSIYLDDLIGYLSGKSNEADGINYQLNFETRQLFWRYYVINRSQIALNDPHIKSKSGLQFQPPESTKLDSGESALRFQSKPLFFPLTEVMQDKFSLITQQTIARHDSGQSVERCLIDGLPIPNVKQLTITRVSETPYLCSEMYVYL